MLQTEFHMSYEEADIMFGVFDKDNNNELSLWEFQQFYNTIGADAHEYLTLFHTLEKDHSGCVDIEKCFDAMKTLKTGSGRYLEEREIEMFMKSTAGPSKSIDMPKFINLLCRVKIQKDLPPKQESEAIKTSQ
ncbi:uncharacterized protein LOC121385312 isoform X2 [Gigantopelta aegis]|nr:uncharacterized protein LOC121385312 isoform X2 [Gigantopelta aegis]